MVENRTAEKSWNIFKEMLTGSLQVEQKCLKNLSNATGFFAIIIALRRRSKKGFSVSVRYALDFNY